MLGQSDLDLNWYGETDYIINFVFEIALEALEAEICDVGKACYISDTQRSEIFRKRGFIETGTQSEHFRQTKNRGAAIMYSKW